jgi:hypothetical protein
MNQSRIVIDGRTYNSVNEMPADVRAKYEKAMKMLRDQNRDGRPDVFDVSSSTQVVSNTMKFVVDGREYSSIEDLPPETRAKYEQAMSAVDKNQNGIPDFVEDMMGRIPQGPAKTNTSSATSPRPASRAPQSASPTISPDTSNGWMLVLAGGLLMLLCAAGAIGVWYFLLR